MGMYTVCELSIKHVDGSTLNYDEIENFAGHLENADMFWEWCGDEAYYNSTSINTYDDVTNAISSYAKEHPDVKVMLIVDYDDGYGCKVLFCGEEQEVLQKIVTYEEPEKIKWD